MHLDACRPCTARLKAVQALAVDLREMLPPVHLSTEEAVSLKETVGGHASEKTKVTVTGEKGEKHDAVVWYATDLKEFPVQMQMTQDKSTVTMLYRDVQLAKPDAALFEAPNGYTRHTSIEQLMQSAMARIMGGAK